MSVTAIKEVHSHGNSDVSIFSKTQFTVEFTQEEADGIRRIAKLTSIPEETIIRFSLRDSLGFNQYEGFSQEDVFNAMANCMEDGRITHERSRLEATY
ncbi:hypothetical protein H5P28_09005 [Ruficoccus amylovorans]|uniref:Uncharacterized protein n=1 Tax=Ruficoccus amylovorans TaxID=1804625 RepID=A0A842HD26_9BACT|nr:hypothetical protein [Ruficoccus amylovorans]MBC2594393.1 hypothetical protein [Ruficoccus amylovorans]